MNELLLDLYLANNQKDLYLANDQKDLYLANNHKDLRKEMTWLHLHFTEVSLAEYGR